MKSNKEIKQILKSIEPNIKNNKTLSKEVILATLKLNLKILVQIAHIEILNKLKDGKHNC
jgi:hypothetical protein